MIRGRARVRARSGADVWDGIFRTNRCLGANVLPLGAVMPEEPVLT